ncbi:hypothetical protein [Helicobacter ailurogastricus]|nr:hypothetical protein [Helicobacter ailurogastricus]
MGKVVEISPQVLEFGVDRLGLDILRNLPCACHLSQLVFGVQIDRFWGLLVFMIREEKKSLSPLLSVQMPPVILR